MENIQTRPKPNPASTRIKTAKSFTNEDMCNILQVALLEARADRKPTADVLCEVLHEIKHRLSKQDWVVRKEAYRDRYDDDDDDEDYEDD